MACRSEQYSGGVSSGTNWSNWAELAGGRVDTLCEPSSLADIVGIVQDAEAKSQHVRVVGSGWAFEDCAYSPDVMVSLVRLHSVLDYVTDPDAGALLQLTLPNGRSLVHVEAGMKVATLNAQLAARGLAMPTLGGSNGQSIVGALSTSTHGGDFDEPPFCDLVHALHLVGVGGQEYWIERETAAITSNSGLARVLPCPDTLVIRDDEAFDAIVVGLGRFGIIYSVILEAVPAYSLAQAREVMLLPQALNYLRAGVRDGTDFRPLLDALPPPPTSVSTVGDARAMQLLIDPRSPAVVHAVRNWLATGPDQMGSPSNPMCDLGSAKVIAIGAGSILLLGMNPAALKDPLILADPTRPAQLTAKAAELAALAVSNPDMRPGDAFAAVANAYWELGISQLPDALSLVAYLFKYSTISGPSYAVMTGGPMYDLDGNLLPNELFNCYKANSCEIAFDAADSRYIDFLELIAVAAPGFRQAGYISARFSTRSRALLSMQNVMSQHAVSIEVSAFKNMLDSASWIEFVLQTAQALGGRPHWGQQNHPAGAQVAQMYGNNLARWRAVLGGFSGDSTLFSSSFTIARELEPQGARAINVEGAAWQLHSAADAAIAMLLLDPERAPTLTRGRTLHG
jgi:hypothetical protein